MMTKMDYTRELVDNLTFKYGKETVEKEIMELMKKEIEADGKDINSFWVCLKCGSLNEDGVTCSNCGVIKGD
jgi:rubrerythrin